MKWLALDIGGANVKAADGHGYAQSYVFHLWKTPSKLSQQIRTAIYDAQGCDHVAVTMTGELADCFETKSAGVRFILQAVADGCDNRHTRVYLTDGRFVTPQVAASLPKLTAASNWHALANFAGRFAPAGTALLIDIGSTTCDVIPLIDGVPKAIGKTDTERLLSGELVYTGIERSPVCGIASSGPYRGQECPLAQELFATTRDVYTVLDKIPEDSACTATADNRPATKANSRVRLGRMLAADGEDFNHRDAVQLAQSIADAQLKTLMSAVRKVQSKLSRAPTTVLLSGHGDFVIDALLAAVGLSEATKVSLTRELGPMVSRCAPAHALAVIAREMTTR